MAAAISAFFGSLFGSSDKKEESEEEKKEEVPTLNILLLGTLGSGKTTLYKQFEALYSERKLLLSIPGSGVLFSDNRATKDPIVTITQYIDSIHRHIIEEIHSICQFIMMRLSMGDETIRSIEYYDEVVMEAVAAIGMRADWAEDRPLEPKTASMLERIWKEPGVQEVCQIRSRSHIMDCSRYFLDRVTEIASEDYKPSFEDYLRIRQRTVGIVRQRFTIEMRRRKWNMILSDLGGSRHERVNWTPRARGTDILVWMMSLTGYDRVLWENHDVNVFDDNFLAFKQIARRSQFDSTDFVILLSKYDILKEKLQEVPFTVYDKTMPSDEASDPECVVNRITERMKQIWDDSLSAEQKASKERSISFHTVSALDTESVSLLLYNIQASRLDKMMH